MKNQAAKFLVLTVLLTLGIFLNGCFGERVEQDKIVLKFQTLGERDTGVSNIEEESEEGKAAEVDKRTYETELLTATRLPVFQVGVKFLKFPRGNQAYKFTKRKSVESPDNEEFCINASDGNVCFDAVVHMHINSDYPDLKDRLVRFTKTYSLMQYSGRTNTLDMFIRTRFRPIMHDAFMQYGAEKRTLDLIRNKVALNGYMMKVLNDQFNRYGLTFTLVGVSSAIRPSEAQQSRMNEIIVREKEGEVLKLENEKIAPLVQKAAMARLGGEKETNRIISEANAYSINIIAAAREARRNKIIEQIGPANYILFEQLDLVVNALNSGKTKVDLVPDASVLVRGNGQVIPADLK